MIEWPCFFPDNTRVAALPHWEAPRLFIPADTVRKRWKRSSFYPAFRRRARLMRIALRTWAAAGLFIGARQVHANNWPLGSFIEDALPDARSVSVLIGTPGPAQKTIVQIWNEADQVIGYLKYGEKPMARRRLHREHNILSNLPPTLGPRPLKFGCWQNGKALLISPLEGASMAGSFPPPHDLIPFCHHPLRTSTVSIAKHPWIQERLATGTFDHLLDPLAGRKWPVVIQHGDLAPWNLRRDADDRLNAFDWEYGVLQGFPYLDVAHYILQVAALIYHWPPEKALTYAVSFLTDHPFTTLSTAETKAIVRLAAYDGYRHAEEDGHPPDQSLQQWRYAIWN